MKPQLLRALVAASVASAAFSAQAASVTLTGWAYGQGNVVNATGYNGPAGGFMGSLTGIGTYDVRSFLTYCIELEEGFSFGNTAITGYAVVDGASYFARRRGDADIADRIGRLMTYVSALAAPVANSEASSALQLAIWNMVYDSDYSVTTAGRFNDLSSLDLAANSFLAGAASVAVSQFTVFALERAGTQDFLLLVPAANGVPEPGSLALAGGALGLMWGSRRRSTQAEKRG